MKFALNDEQQALSDTIYDFFKTHVSSSSIRNSFVSPKGYDEELYSLICEELGLTSLIVPEEFGGYGASDVELAVVLDHHGYSLAPTPLRTHLSAQIAISECALEEYRGIHLERLFGSSELAACMFDDEYTVVVSGSSTKPIINGRFARIPFGHTISHLYFVCQIGGINKLVYLDCSTSGVEKFLVPSIDQTQPLGAIECTNALVEIISDDVEESFERAKSRTIIAATNEMVGSAQAVLDMGVSYAKDRIQFSRPIGSFQAIKHKCADMLLETESARSIALFGAWLASQPRDFISHDIESDLNHVASMAKYYCSNSLSHAAGENIQIHGGIGFTMEHDAQLYFKRAAFMRAHLGMPHYHAGMLAKQLAERIG